MTDDRLSLPEGLREELKEPMGPVYADPGTLVADAGRPLVAVGDVVTYHLLEAGHRPDVALVDDRTEREPVDPAVADAITGFDREIAVANPAGTLSAALADAIREGLAGEGASTVVRVDGEEDLGTLAAVLAVPAGGSVVYGQPGAGMVLVAPEAVEATVRDLLERMDGDSECVLGAFGE